MKLVALKRLRYPSGPQGKEYAAGESFEVLSERDADVLKLIRSAKDFEKKTRAPRQPKPSLETTSMRAAEPAPAPLEKPATETAPSQSPVMQTNTPQSESLFEGQQGQYSRRDMRAED